MKRLLFLLLFIFAACSDNSTNPAKPVDANDFLPLAVGNYWIYEYSDLDRSNQPTGKIYIDSILITGKKKIKEDTFYTFVTFRDNQAIDTAYWNIKNLSIFMLATAENANLPGFSNTVFKMVELYKSDWYIFNYNHDSLLINIGGEENLFSGEFNFHGYRNYGDDTIYIHGKQFVAMSTKIVQNAKYTESNPPNTIYIDNLPIYYYYMENIGQVLIRKESRYIVEQGNSNNKTWFNGWQRQMIRYHLE